jgi:hypothetical protein
MALDNEINIAPFGTISNIVLNPNAGNHARSRGGQ